MVRTIKEEKEKRKEVCFFSLSRRTHTSTRTCIHKHTDTHTIHTVSQKRERENKRLTDKPILIFPFLTSNSPLPFSSQLTLPCHPPMSPSLSPSLPSLRLFTFHSFPFPLFPSSFAGSLLFHHVLSGHDAASSWFQGSPKSRVAAPPTLANEPLTNWLTRRKRKREKW